MSDFLLKFRLFVNQVSLILIGLDYEIGEEEEKEGEC